MASVWNAQSGLTWLRLLLHRPTALLAPPMQIALEETKFRLNLATGVLLRLRSGS